MHIPQRVIYLNLHAQKAIYLVRQSAISFTEQLDRSISQVISMACSKNQVQIRYHDTCYMFMLVYSDENNDIHLRKEKTLIRVTKFEINENNQIVICPGRLVVGRLGVQRIELAQYGQRPQTIIETEHDILNFSLCLGIASC